jgi:hypothetical protein
MLITAMFIQLSEFDFALVAKHCRTFQRRALGCMVPRKYQLFGSAVIAVLQPHHVVGIPRNHVEIVTESVELRIAICVHFPKKVIFWQTLRGLIKFSAKSSRDAHAMSYLTSFSCLADVEKWKIRQAL